MADLSITAADVAAVLVIEQHTGPAAEAVDAGEACCLAAASGKLALADEDAAALDDPMGIAVTNGNAANVSITVITKGLIDVGSALAGLNYGDLVYLSATPGKLADADPGNTKVIGKVWPGWGYTTADKLLRVDL